MCDNIIVLYIFMIIKVIAIFILPIFIFIKRKKESIKILFFIDLIILAFFYFGNLFRVNRCTYNSSFYGINLTKEGNFTIEYDKLHPFVDSVTDQYTISPSKNLKTYGNTSLYYYNQNKPYMSSAYFECNKNKVYMDSFGSGLTSFSIVISTLYNNNINPVQLLDVYKNNNDDLCTNKMELLDIYSATMKVYGGITMKEISSNEVYNGIKKGGYVIVELSSNENSKLTCDNGHIVIYNIAKDDKYMIADPSLKDSSYVCPYSSAAYGNIISSDNMNKSWSMDEIDNEAVRYYLVMKG